MPSYRFRWEAFSDQTVNALAIAKGYRGASQGARDWLADKVKRPTPEFVGEMKDVLVKHWLPGYPGAEQIVDRLLEYGIGPMGSPRSQNGYVQYIASCRNSMRLRRLLCDAMIRFGDTDNPSADDGLDLVRRFATLNVREQPTDSRKPHGYQLQAWDNLNRHLAESRSTQVFQGLLVMPTGSGKTFTAVRWLCQNVLSEGKRVLWIAHRHELLSATAREFHRLAGYAAPKEKLRVRIVSVYHCSMSQIDPADDVIIASIGSIARRKQVTSDLLADPKLFIVVDEAHHSTATTYREVLEAVQERKPWYILGLTATATRTIESERPALTKLYGNRILFQEEVARLIEQKILARPIPVVVKTGADVEAGVTDEDIKHHERFNEISEDWYDRIAHLTARNGVIVQHYLKNQKKYGPTLIFAINVPHAALLADDFRNAGVRADYVASYRPDGTPGNPAEVVQDFRDRKLDVLINVQMLTEGVDLPLIETIFLTRPTSSEILLRQMIGRALRGPASGGAEKAYLVSFEDHWTTFHDWDSPFDLVPDIAEVAEALDTKAPVEPAKPAANQEVKDQFAEHLPWDTIRLVATALRQAGPEHHADAFEAIPDGWLVFERVEEDQAVRVPIAMYQHQRECWDQLIHFMKTIPDAQRASCDSKQLYEYFFGDCDSPAPSEHQVGQLIEHFRQGGPSPEYHDLEGRAECDPYEVAKKIHTNNLSRRETSELIDKSYTALARAIYSERRQYQSAVDDALYELDHPEEATSLPRAVPIFAPRPDQQLTAGPCHDLAKLMQEVLQTGAGLLGVSALTYTGKLEWSKKLIKGYYGKAYYLEQPPLIRINCLLDSPDIEPNTLKFLLWHEFLHVHLKVAHTVNFREAERKWPGMVEADRQLDTLNEKFGIQYW